MLCLCSAEFKMQVALEMYSSKRNKRITDRNCYQRRVNVLKIVGLLDITLLL